MKHPDPTTTGRFHIGFEPWVSVKVEDGRVVDVVIDWSDSHRNTYTDDPEKPGRPMDELLLGHDTYSYAASSAAADYLDQKTVQEAVAAAIRSAITA